MTDMSALNKPKLSPEWSPVPYVKKVIQVHKMSSSELQDNYCKKQ